MDYFQVTQILIKGNKNVSSQDLKNFIFEKIDLPLLKIQNRVLLSSKNFFLISKKKIENEVLKNFFSVQNVEIKKIFPNTLLIEIKEKKPVAKFCQYFQNKEEKCFLLDEQGFIFSFDDALKKDFFIVYHYQSFPELSLGQKIIEKNIINFLLQLQEILKEKFQVELKKVLIKSPLRVDVETNEGWRIFFNIENEKELNYQIVKLIVLLKDEIKENQRKNLDYIDLRFKDRAQIMSRKNSP